MYLKRHCPWIYSEKHWFSTILCYFVVTDAHHFKDELLLYQFRSGFVASTAVLQDLTRVSSESDTVDIMSMGDNANKHFSRHLSIPNDKMIKPGNK